MKTFTISVIYLQLNGGKELNGGKDSLVYEFLVQT